MLVYVGHSLSTHKGALQDVTITHKGVLQDITITHKGALQDITITHKGALQDINITHKGALQDVTITHKGALQDITITHKGALQDITITHKGALQDVTITHKGALQDVTITHKGALQDITITHKGALQDVTITHKGALQDITITHKGALQDITITHKGALQDITITHKGALQDVTITHKGALQDVTITQKGALQDITITHKGALQDVTITHKGALQDVTITHKGVLQDITITHTFRPDTIMFTGLRSRSSNLTNAAMMKEKLYKVVQRIGLKLEFLSESVRLKLYMLFQEVEGYRWFILVFTFFCYVPVSFQVPLVHPCVYLLLLCSSPPPGTAGSSLCLPSSAMFLSPSRYRWFILVFTFFCYASYHLSRKPISVVKSVLHQNCSKVHADPSINTTSHPNWCDWAPFDHDDYKAMFGTLDVCYLVAYAVAMFLSGHIADRMNLRYYLSGGMILSGIFTIGFGLGYFYNIHAFYYYIAMQIIGGAFQASGWPGVVTCVGNWFGKGKRGLIMGVWNAHTSVGNMLGSVIAGAFVESNWGLSFVVPGIIIGAMGVLVFLFLVPHPKDVDCMLPDHSDASVKEAESSSRSATINGDEDTDGNRNVVSGRQSAVDDGIAQGIQRLSDASSGHEVDQSYLPHSSPAPCATIFVSILPPVAPFSLFVS
ncbi:hypothetical protein RRG08_066667 [Elysia crispata]|uniref:Major facilitator superfamily (MFS) profile domain-containing protein n=1 Tax=Elysia crispata TaxID=231223 RepID=A0AAE1B407_9GAST|nr:hypothetical protein RRG08_066667 [Elysia crispata]